MSQKTNNMHNFNTGMVATVDRELRPRQVMRRRADPDRPTPSHDRKVKEASDIRTFHMAHCQRAQVLNAPSSSLRNAGLDELAATFGLVELRSGGST
jgi:hypothetical protein